MEIIRSVAAYFVSTSYFYRYYEFSPSLTFDELRKAFYFLPKNNPLLRGYKITPAVARRLDSWIVGEINWDFDVFRYELDVGSPNKKPPPLETFVLSVLTMPGGEDVACVSLKKKGYLSRVFERLPFIGDGTYQGYIQTFNGLILPKQDLQKIIKLFHPLPFPVDFDKYYYELTPALPSMEVHRNYYKKHWGITFDL